MARVAARAELASLARLRYLQEMRARAHLPGVRVARGLGFSLLLCLGLAGPLWAASAAAQRRAWSSRLPAAASLRALRSGDAEARERAARRLGRGATRESVIEALISAFEAERDPGVRLAILGSLGGRVDPASLELLASVLAAGTPRERSMAANALGDLASPEALAVLVDALPGRRSGQAAAAALRRAGDQAVPLLIRALRARETAAPAAGVLARAALEGRRTRAVKSALRRAVASTEPAVRAAALSALAPAAGPEDEPLLLSALDDTSPSVVVAALEGLGRVATPRAWPKLTQALAGASEGDRRGILRALVRSDVRAAAPILREMFAAGETSRALALDVALEARSPALLSLYTSAWRAGERPEQIASVLIHLPRAAGLPLLAERQGRLAERELAVALRSLGSEVPRSVRRATLERLAALPRLVALEYRALARDRSALPELREELGQASPLRRAAAARALGALARAEGLPWLLAALSQEPSPVAFRAMARAAVDLGGGLPSSSLAPYLESPGTAPEAMALAARAPEAGVDSSLRRSLRRSLRAPEPRVRAGAARALALMRDTRAGPSLVAALGDESLPVRLAIASALRALGHAAVIPGFVEALRREPDERVRAVLTRAAHAQPGPFDREGGEVLRVRVRAQGRAAAAHALADVLLADGRWLRVSADQDAELWVADLPLGDADVRLRLSPP